ncbi:MAG: ATP-binding cassette domain-containing protein [Nanobdellota archaeon]
MLKIKNINKSFGKNQIYKDFNLEVKKGQVMALLGNSGIGKTTLLRCINGLDDYSGKIKLTGNFSVLFQENRLCPWLTCKDNILLPFKLMGKEITPKIKNNMKLYSLKLGLDEIYKKYPNEISGGQQRRVAFLRTLVTEPDLFILDEPFTSIEDKLKKRICEWFFSYCKNNKKTVIYATHEKEFIKYSDKTINLNKIRKF